MKYFLQIYNLSGEKAKSFEIKKSQSKRLGLFMWYPQESNQGHMDFQSIALPTELGYRITYFFFSIFSLFALPSR